MKQKLLSLLLAGCLLFASLPAAFAVELPDTPTAPQEQQLTLDDAASAAETSAAEAPASEDTADIPAQDDPDYEKIVSDRARRIASTNVSKAYKAATKHAYPAKSKTYDVNKTYKYVAPNAYAKLTDDQKALYDEMLPKVRNLEPISYMVSDTSDSKQYEKLDNALVAYSAMTEDYPELDIYFGLFDVLDGDTTIGLESHYYMPDSSTDDVLTTKEELDGLRYQLDLFDAVCDYVVAGMPDGTAYNKYLYLASYIASRTEYDYTFQMGPQISNSYGAILSGHSVCQGYATGMVYLCKKANLYCKMVSGSSRGEGHAWNLVRLSTGTYHVDVTWSDTSGAKLASKDWYNYFMMTQAEVCYDHEIDEADGTFATGVTLPKPEKTSDFLMYGTDYLKKDLTYCLVSLSKRGTGTVAVSGSYKKTPLTTLTIPSKVTLNGRSYSVVGVDDYALRNCKNLQSVSIGKKTRFIGKKAFYNDAALKDITIRSQSLNTVGSSAIRNINKKAVIHVPSGKRKAYRKLFTTKTGYTSTMRITTK